MICTGNSFLPQNKKDKSHFLTSFEKRLKPIKIQQM